MANQKGGLGVFEALAYVLMILGLLALAAHYIGILPKY